MIDRRELGAVFLGGALGTLLRAGLLEAIGEGAPGWPWATFAANMVGAFLLGYLVTALPTMLEAGRLGIAVGYLAASLCGGLLGVHLATATARRPEAAR